MGETVTFDDDDGQLGFMMRMKLLVCINETTPLRYKIAFYLNCKESVYPLCNHLIVVAKVFP